MKETEFIAQHKSKWKRFEKLYKSSSKKPDEVSDLYLEITNDLSHAKTYYDRRSVRVYLNGLAQKVYNDVHQNPKQSLKKILDVWRISLPLEIYRSRHNLLFALVSFLIYVAIGAITTYIYPEFPREVMGDAYVDTTINNIQSGNPLKIYETTSQIKMFYDITTNNLGVAFLCFFLGFFFTIGTHVLLFSNGVMLGAFQTFFYTKGLLITSFLGIWIHGAFEISAIVLSAGAGITVGTGLMFPKSYSRLQALQLSAKRGLKIMLSLVPFIILAGFLESYVTHNYQRLAEWTKWSIILFSFGVIILTYVIYPLFIARKYPERVINEDVPKFPSQQPIQLFEIRNTLQQVKATIQIYGRKFTKILGLNLSYLSLPVIVILITQANNHTESLGVEYWYDWASQLQFVLGSNLSNWIDFVIFGLWSILFTIMFRITFFVVKEDEIDLKALQNYIKTTPIQLWAGVLLWQAVTLLTPYYVFILPVIFYGWIWPLLPTLSSKDLNFFKALKFPKKNYFTSIGVMVMLAVFIGFTVQPIASILSISNTNNEPAILPDLLDIASKFIREALVDADIDAVIVTNLLRQVVYTFSIFILFPLIFTGMAVNFYSLQEKNESIGLRKAMEQFGKRSRIKEK